MSEVGLMADQFNSQYERPLFGIDGPFNDSGAPGSTGIAPQEHSGAQLGVASGSSVMGSAAYASRMPQLDQPVGQGDSNSFSDGLSAHSSAITGDVDQAQFMSHPWTGQVETVRHPDNMWNPS